MKENVLKFIKKNAPCYVYDESTIIEHAQILEKSLPQFSFLFSVKANPYAPVMKTIAEQGVGADAASAREVFIASESGMKREDIYYSAAGMSVNDIETTIGKCTLIADSLTELELIDKIAGEKGIHERVGLRINPLFAMGGGKGGSSKFGVDEELVYSEIDRIKALKNVTFAGVHVHLRSQILDYKVLGEYYSNIYKMAKKFHDELSLDIDFINFGGGVGTVYDEEHEQALDFTKLLEVASEFIKDNDNSLKAKLIIESGRFLVCNAGTYYSPVVDIKESRGTKYVLVQNALNGFMRPAIAELLKSYTKTEDMFSTEPFYTSKYAFHFDVLKDTTETETVNLCGNLCTGTDILKNGVTIKKTEVGDIVSVTNAGSYAYSLSPITFSSHPLPKQCFLSKDGNIE